MARFGISGIWTNGDDITHYALHTLNGNTASKAVKTTKAEAIRRIDGFANTATTIVWHYSLSEWDIGEEVEVVNGMNGKYLRSNPNDTKTDNLAHLINNNFIY